MKEAFAMPEITPQPTWFDRFWPSAAAATGVGYLATAYAVSRWLTRPSPAVLEAPTHLSGCTVEALQCLTSDGILLKGWHITPLAPAGTVALFHGMRLNRSHMLERIEFLTAAGLRCVAFDHRAHGESGGRLTSFGFHERHDVAAVLDLIHSRWPNEPRAALGVSMGAAAVCLAGEMARGFDAIILESVYYDLARAFEQRVGRGYPAWFQQFRSGIVWFTERRLHLKVAQVSPASQIDQLSPRPVLLLTGSDDPHAPPDEVEQLAARIPATSRFCVIPGAGHADVCTRGGRAYQNLVLRFFAEHRIGNRLPAVA
jgi:alpha-beta hydrolase superfamily lysophospholipase